MILLRTKSLEGQVPANDRYGIKCVIGAPVRIEALVGG